MSFDVKINGDFLEIRNNSEQFFENCLVSLKNIFFDDLVFEETNIAPKIEDVDNTKSFALINRDFKQHWINKEYYLRIYSNERLIFDKVINDRTKCFVLVSNEKYSELTIKLIEQLLCLTKVDISNIVEDIEVSHNIIVFPIGSKISQPSNAVEV